MLASTDGVRLRLRLVGIEIRAVEDSLGGNVTAEQRMYARTPMDQAVYVVVQACSFCVSTGSSRFVACSHLVVVPLSHGRGFSVLAVWHSDTHKLLFSNVRPKRTDQIK